MADRLRSAQTPLGGPSSRAKNGPPQIRSPGRGNGSNKRGSCSGCKRAIDGAVGMVEVEGKAVNEHIGLHVHVCKHCATPDHGHFLKSNIRDIGSKAVRSSLASWQLLMGTNCHQDVSTQM